MESTFEERTDLIAKLGIKVLPSEDLKSRKIFCRLKLVRVNDKKEQAGFAKLVFGRPKCTIDRTFTVEFALL